MFPLVAPSVPPVVARGTKTKEFEKWHGAGAAPKTIEKFGGICSIYYGDSYGANQRRFQFILSDWIEIFDILQRENTKRKRKRGKKKG